MYVTFQLNRNKCWTWSNGLVQWGILLQANGIQFCYALHLSKVRKKGILKVVIFPYTKMEEKLLPLWISMQYILATFLSQNVNRLGQSKVLHIELSPYYCLTQCKSCPWVWCLKVMFLGICWHFFIIFGLNSFSREATPTDKQKRKKKQRHIQREEAYVHLERDQFLIYEVWAMRQDRDQVQLG